MFGKELFSVQAASYQLPKSRLICERYDKQQKCRSKKVGQSIDQVVVSIAWTLKNYERGQLLGRNGENNEQIRKVI